MISNQVKPEYGWLSIDSLSDHDYTLPAIKSLLPLGELVILDVGCGNGFVASKLAELGHSVIGIDASEDGINLARRAYPNVRFEVYSAYNNLRKIVSGVDVVVSSEVIEHIYSPKKYLSRIHEVIKPSGNIILTTPYHGFLKNLAISILNGWDKHFTVDWDGGHIKFFSERTLSKLLVDCDFRDIRFANAGRVRWLWKSMVCSAEKPAKP